MVYTLTFSPSIDYVMEMKNITQGSMNRASATHVYPGGKGINVSAVLDSLGTDNTVLGFIAGFTGDGLERGLADMRLAADLIRVDPKWIRENFTIVQEMTLRELRGEECFLLEDEPPAPQSIWVSRSFGELISSREEIHRAVALFATRAAERLRRCRCAASAIIVQLDTNRFRTDLPNRTRPERSVSGNRRRGKIRVRVPRRTTRTGRGSEDSDQTRTTTDTQARHAPTRRTATL